LGLTKRWLEEEEAIRYYTSDESVCARCFHDREIQRSIQQHQAEHTCSVCNRTSKNSVAAPADKVLHSSWSDCIGVMKMQTATRSWSYRVS
jgi:hypothetical protein